MLEKKFTRIRDLRNRLAHHEAVWKFQEEDPVTGAPDYNRPVYGLQASLQLLRRAWKDMLEALSWLSPARHAAFLAEGHHLRFEALATHDGLLSFTGRAQLMHDLNVPHDKVNVNGGAIAIGHPIGASGARILNTLLFEMARRDAKKGLATLCIGGGMGVALCVER